MQVDRMTITKKSVLEEERHFYAEAKAETKTGAISSRIRAKSVRKLWLSVRLRKFRQTLTSLLQTA